MHEESVPDANSEKELVGIYVFSLILKILI